MLFRFHCDANGPCLSQSTVLSLFLPLAFEEWGSAEVAFAVKHLESEGSRSPPSEASLPARSVTL